MDPALAGILWTILILIVIVGMFALFVFVNQRAQAIAEKARIDAENARLEKINAHRSEWGDGVCQNLIDKNLLLEMTQDMVRLAWGGPSSVDSQETTKAHVKERWIYGQARQGASYVWFTDGKITKIKM